MSDYDSFLDRELNRYLDSMEPPHYCKICDAGMGPNEDDVCSECLAEQGSYTKGPWRIEMTANYMRLYMPCGVDGDVARGYVGAANARLICAAPEMYEALKDISEVVSDNALITKALAKAEGQNE